MQKPAIVLQPDTHREMQKGIHTLVNAIRPTVGPGARVVALESIVQNKGIEMLDNGGLIARRIIELQNRSADVGAMYLRHLIWDVSEKVGDGTATTAILFESIFDAGIRYIAAGGNAMRLRDALESGLDVMLEELTKQARPLARKAELAQIARTLSTDPQLSDTLGEIFDMIGPNGRLEIRAGRSREVISEYVVGSYWSSGLMSSKFVNRIPEMRGELTDAAVLLTDLEINTPQELLPLLRLVKEKQIKKLAIFARNLSEVAIGVLRTASNDPEVFQAIAILLPGKNEQDQMLHAEDLCAMTGGRFFASAASQTLNGIRSEDLGRVRRIWADKNYFVISGFGGDPIEIRRHIERLQLKRDRAEKKALREKLQTRLELLSGGTAVMHIGAATESEMKWRAAQAHRAASTLRQASLTGVLPGGGIAFLNCQARLKGLIDAADNPDDRAAYRMLHKACEIPLRTIAENGGYDPSEILARVRIAPTLSGFDAVRGKIIPQDELGLWDAAGVVQTAVINAVKGVALALTTDVIVHHKHPEQAQEP